MLRGSSAWIAAVVTVASALVLAPVPSRATAALPAAAATRAVPQRSNAVIERRVIGRSVKGRPIVAYRKGNPDAARKVVVLGSMHGDEHAGVTTATYLIKHVAVSLDADVWIIPTMNPDGVAQHRRTNAHGVDLNRNWPMNWHRGPRNHYYPGRRAASEPETRAMIAFLSEVQPIFVTSIHQPFGKVGLYDDKPRAFQRRLARELNLPLRNIPIPGKHGKASGKVAKNLQPHGADNDPTLTGWYNAHYPGTAMTVEYTAHPSKRFTTAAAATGILRASLAR